MAYRIELDEQPGEALRRILREQTSVCVKQLEAAGICEPTAVHETRRSLKRIRALLRLMRSGLGDYYERENGRYRDVGRLLSGQRDRHILIATLDVLEREHGPFVDPRVAKLRELAQSAGALAGSDGRENGAIVAQALRQLKQGVEAIDALALEPDEIEVVLDGVEATMKRCSGSFARAVDGKDVADWHEWRKSVQQHWRQMRLLNRAWPAYYKARAKAASEVAQILGRAQDLTVLQTFLGTTACLAVGDGVCEPLSELATRRIGVLHEAVRPLGHRLLAESPRGLRRRTMLYWHSACELVPAAAAEARKTR